MMSVLKTKQPPPPDYILPAALQVWDQAGGKHYISITGRSMLPLIQEGDQVLVSHGGAAVRPGDVVVFRQEGTLVAHRVMRIPHHHPGQVFLTKGDNTLHFDPPVPGDKIVGRVLAVERAGQIMSLTTPFWRMAGRFIVAVTLPVAKLYSWARAVKRFFFGTQSYLPIRSLNQRGKAIFAGSLNLTLRIYRWRK